MAENTDIQGVIDSQLKQYYASFEHERENRIKIRNWVVTIWISCVAILGSGKIKIDYVYSIVFFFTLIVFFWAIEGLHLSFILRDLERLKSLEKLLSNKELPEHVPIRLFYSHDDNKPLKYKLKHFSLACLTGETIIFFYLTLLLGSGIFIYLSNSYNFITVNSK